MTISQIKAAAIEKARAFYAGNETAQKDLDAVLANLERVPEFWTIFPNSAFDMLIKGVRAERVARIQREAGQWMTPKP